MTAQQKTILEEIRRATRMVFERDKNALLQRLSDTNCRHAVHALEFAEPYHQGFRRDGATPSFQHQVTIALQASKALFPNRELPNELASRVGFDIDNALAIIILHDTPEDNPRITREKLARKFNERIADVAYILNKNDPSGTAMPNPQYYARTRTEPESMLAKPFDKLNNIETMFHLASDDPRKPANGPAKYFLEGFQFYTAFVSPITDSQIEASKRECLQLLHGSHLVQTPLAHIRETLDISRTLIQYIANNPSDLEGFTDFREQFANARGRGIYTYPELVAMMASGKAQRIAAEFIKAGIISQPAPTPNRAGEALQRPKGAALIAA
ncbi:MAG: hypothetical protein SFW62_03375 [Alphaproteobacteria bacterium]|nr:hypothetical protein [Alphaproteobacteria bacterium]